MYIYSDGVCMLMPLEVFGRVSCGFPSPAAAYAEKNLVIDDWLWPARSSSSLIPWGRGRRLYLVVDRTATPRSGDRIWFAGNDSLPRWPLEGQGIEQAASGFVVTGTVRLYRDKEELSKPGASVHERVVTTPYASYLAIAEGKSMRAFGITNGCLLVVDRSETVRDGDIVLAGTAQGFLVKQFRENPDRLVAGHADYAEIRLGREEDIQMDGVVTACLWSRRHSC